MRVSITLFALACVAIVLCGTVPFSVDELITLERLGEPVMSPNGTFYAYTGTTYMHDSDAATTALYLGTVDGSGVTHICPELEAVSGPAWHPDSTHFVFGNGGQPMIYDVESKECYSLTTIPRDIDNLKWSPTGDMIMFSADVYKVPDLWICIYTCISISE
ncbi:hypothetical protein KIPB_011791 [Kipferlia bialata]|uniref:Uncharacterized protein n=1 Tax=Kipferlia bialata TaxID=797122 RepID=A0A9K3GP34_9EUKA|nr:hypothetical protein KIPB_011791 [Kipferlia bialata]|eukprot:g11791.t1